MVRSLGFAKLMHKVNLPYDICYFSEPVKRTLCVEGMKIIEQRSQHRKPVSSDTIKELFKRHNYACQSKQIGRSAPPINAVACPIKFIFCNDGMVLDSYIDGFYFSQSAVVDERLYLWVEGNNDELVPIAEINGIKLAKGSSISDISRAFKPQK